MSIIKFSNPTALSLKGLHFHNELDWSDENENTLDLTNVKRLKGCRTLLVQDCLEFIRKLDVLASADGEKKDYALEKIQTLIEALNHYKVSCDRYPRIKDFLNLAPDYSGETAAFIIIISAIISTVFPPLAALPLFIFSWVLMDLFFNNRDETKNLTEILLKIQNDLRTFQENDTILTETQRFSPSTLPRERASRASYSPSMYGAINQPDTNINYPSTSSTPPNAVLNGKLNPKRGMI
jgi:hypothetical protein